MLVTLTAVFSLPLLVALYYWIRYYYSDKMKYLRGLPTAFPTLPLLGHLHYLLFSKGGLQGAFMHLTWRLTSTPLPLSCFWIGPIPIVLINEPEDVQVLLNKSKALHKSPEYKLSDFYLCKGLVTAEVPHWKVTRRHMMSLFHPQNLEHLVPVFNRTSKQLVQQISTKLGQGPIDVNHYLTDLALRNALCLMFSSQVEDDVDSKVLNTLRDQVKLGPYLSSVRVSKPWLRWDSLFYFLYNKQIQLVVNSVYSLPWSMLKHIEEFENSMQESNDNLKLNEKEISTQQNKEDEDKFPITLPEIYKTIRENHLPVTKEDLIKEFNTILHTGTDTVALTVSNCLLALATHPDVQAKLYNEIIEEVGGEAGVVSSNDVTKLEYIDCVLNETLRRFTSVPYIIRTIETPITFGDYTLPAGTNVTVNVLYMHHNPRLYPNPERFDPDRFTVDNVNQRHKYSFLPFSGGARNCIGKNYAWLLMKIILVHLLREFKVTTTVDINNLEYSYEVVMIPKNAHHITFEKRKK